MQRQHSMSLKKLNIAFFGTPNIAVYVLHELKKVGIIPNLVITNPDRPQGRGLTQTPSDAKVWALENGIAIFQPESLRDKETLTPLTSQQWDLFIVVAYGQIMPKWLIDLPSHRTLNVHPSMLPKLRGASPIRTAILEGGNNMGVSVMLMDEQMDHGPILIQEKAVITFPILGEAADALLARRGGELLATIIPAWIAGEITPQEQNHEEATFCKKIRKEMGEIEINPFNLPKSMEAFTTYRKICALDGWPGTFFFYNEKRIKITEAELRGTALIIKKVIPEGKKEISWDVWLNSLTRLY